MCIYLNFEKLSICQIKVNWPELKLEQETFMFDVV